MRDPRPFVVIQNGSVLIRHSRLQRVGRPARWSRPASRTRPAFSSSRRARVRRDDPRYQERPSRHGLRLSDAKRIRRGMESEAMEFAVELMHTSKAFHSMVCNRLEVICHEDLDTMAAPHVFPFVAASLAAIEGPLQRSRLAKPG